MPLFLTDNFSRFFSFCKKHKRSSLLFVLPLLSISVLIINPSFAAVNSVKEPVVSISVKNEPLKKVLEKISKSTGYKIEVTEGWENKLISADFINTPLDTSLKKIIKALGGPSNSIVTYENAKNIKINIFDSSARSFSNITEVYLENDDNKVMGLDITFAQLEDLHAKQQKEIEASKQDMDEIVIPAEGDQPAVTRGQLKALHEKQKQEIDKNKQDMDEIVIPAEGDQPAITRRQLQALHERQTREIEASKQDMDEIMIQAEGDQPAVTRGQLQALHEKQKQEIEEINQNKDEMIMLDSKEEAGKISGPLKSLQ
jgi:hypothetical protein